MISRWTKALALAAVFAGATTALAQSPPQTVFYGVLSETEQTEVQAWGIAYWTKVEAGTLSTHTFSNPAMNSHRFNPFRGTRATLENLKLLDAADCDKAIIESDPGSIDAVSAAKRQALKDAMVLGTFKTDPVANPDGTIEHIQKILDAGAVQGLVVYTEGGKLTSEKLPLDILIMAGANPEFASELPEATIQAINAILVAAPGYALAAPNVTEFQALVSGAISKTDDVAAHIRQLLFDMQVSWSDLGRYDAVFGVYGSLPIIIVDLPGAYIVVDGTNGNIDGPFTPSSSIDALGLLGHHLGEYANGTGVIYYSTGGCTVSALSARKRWNPTAPGNYPPPFNPQPVAPPGTPVPPYIIPGVPGTSPLAVRPDRPGWFTDWLCTTVPGPGLFSPSCDCSSYGQYLDSTGSWIWVRVRCIGNFPCAAGPPAGPGGIYPATPDTAPPRINPDYPGLPIKPPPFPTPGPAVSPGSSWKCTPAPPRVEFYY